MIIGSGNKIYKRTKSSEFLRPMLGFPPLFYGKSFYNCYFSINPNNIYVVFKKPFDENTNYDYILGDLKNHSHYTDKKDLKNYLILAYSVPKQYDDDFYHFLNGDYSKFSKLYKDRILDLIKTIPTAHNNLKSILYPQEHHFKTLEIKLGARLFKKEIFSRVDIADELFNLNVFKDETEIN